METKASQFFSSLKNKKITFVGIGVSHKETICLFAKQGLAVTVCDRRTEDQIDPQWIAEFRDLGVTLRLGTDNFTFIDTDIVFRTPGMYYNLPALKDFRHQGGIVTSEMEVFCQLCPCPIIAVTGSDGKTTTTTLISEMLKAEGKTVHLGGNIGRALLPIIFDIQLDDVAVVELSSFQLISMRPSPMIAVVTNVTPNHLDVHGTMEEYTEAKKHIFLHQDAFSRTVLGADNEITASFADEVRGDCATFSRTSPVYNGAYLNMLGMLVMSEHGFESPLFSKDEIRLPGLHNVENYLAAMSATQGLVSHENMRKVAKEFAGVEHRIEFVTERKGVRWYNDSIATSPTRAIAGLRSFPQKLILIAGGYDKKIPYEPLAPEIIEHVKLLILTGATADKIEQAVIEHPDYTQGNPVILHAKDMETAVTLADQHAKNGDVVTLSPASASFDLYPNFEVRGQHFKQLVNNLPKED